MGKVRLKKRANNRSKNRNITFKRVVTDLIPTDWDNLLWDLAEDIIAEVAGNAINNALHGEDEVSYTEIQNNYVHNTYITNKTVNNPVVPQVFPPRFNYREPPRVFRSPPALRLPDPILPTDIDNQTATQTPLGSSINVGASVQSDRYKMGKLIFHPYSTNKKGIRRNVPSNFLALEYQKAQQEAVDAISNIQNGEPTPIEYSGWLVSSSNLSGLKGTGHILMGINSISALAQTYRALSSIATIEPTNDIPVEYEDVDIDDEFTQLRFNGKSETMPPTTNLAFLLGYDEDEFQEKTIEDIIKDYWEKQYDPTSQSPTLNPINKLNIENKEQLFTHILASLFFRIGDVKEPPIWELLGYEEEEYKEKSIEEIIKDFGKKIYDNKPVKSIKTANDVIFDIKDKFETKEQFITGIIASLFYRGGFHRLPGELPESLTLNTEKYPNPNDQPTIFIEDMMEYQEYLIKNLDDIFGRFPLNFKYKSIDNDGKEVTEDIKFDNIAECLLEMAGLVLDINNNTDVNTNIGLKTLAQTIKATTAASIATDFSKTIIDCLGFDYDEFERKITIPITPDAPSLPLFLQNNETKILGIKKPLFETNVKTLLNKVTAYAGIAAAAVGQKEKFLTGDAIRDVIQKKKTGVKDKYDKQWEELLAEYNKTNKTSDDKFPKAKIKDKKKPNIP